jgi:hypothetical protein
MVLPRAIIEGYPNKQIQRIRWCNFLFMNVLAMGGLVWVDGLVPINFCILKLCWCFDTSCIRWGKFEWSEWDDWNLGILKSKLKLKYVLSSHINNINHVSKFDALLIVSLLIKIVEMSTSVVFLGVSFTHPNITNNAWTSQSITLTKIIFHLFYLSNKALSS